MGNIPENDDYCYIYLDFNEKLAPNIFTKRIFLRVANLHKPNPLIQLNDLLFKGSYDEAVGTNIFFEEIEDPPLKTNLFEKDTPIQLKLLLAQTKTLKLKKVKLPRNVGVTDNHPKENIQLNLNQDYKVLLEKLQQNTIDLEDLGNRVDSKGSENEDDAVYEHRADAFVEPIREIDNYLGTLNNNSSNTLLEAKYEKLKRLARRPVRRMKEPEEVEECDAQYKNAFEYHNLERQICQSSDYFRTVSGVVVDQSFTGGIDLDRCVLHGLIRGDDSTNRILTKEEQSKVFSLTNLENLSIPMRYLLLKQCISSIENLIETTDFEQLHEKDKDGRTIIDICNIFRRLSIALEDVMASEKNLVVRTKSIINDRPEDEYIKYRYNTQTEILREFYDEHFNIDDWEDIDLNKDKKQQESDVESDDLESN